MKKIIKTIALSLAICLLGSCFGPSTQELANEVEKGIQNWLVENETDLTVRSFTLMHVEGNKYSGIVTIADDEGDADDFKVEVIYDGENVSWEIPNFYQQLFMKGFFQGLMEE